MHMTSAVSTARIRWSGLRLLRMSCALLPYAASPLRRFSLALLCMSALLLLNACSASSTAKPYTDMPTVTIISSRVAAAYREANPQITKVTATLTDGPTAVPMNSVALDGHFHNGNLAATHLSFSMLSDGSKVWAILATDDQYTTTHTPVWIDHDSTIKL